MAGDKIDIWGKSYYFTALTSGTTNNKNITTLSILTGLLGGPTGGTAAAAHGGVTDVQLNGMTNTTTGINSLFSDQLTEIPNSSTKPRAFINYIFFDEQFKSVGSGLDPVGSEDVVKTHQITNKVAPANGYVYIYVSNQSQVDVFFDNLQVVHTRGAILEENHYYPFGLTMQGISSRALAFGEPGNKKGYNGNELQNKEFSDGSGLEFYDFKFRGLDVQIGRFMQIDPLADMSLNYSPYAYGNNNPILLNDPLGLASDTAWKVLREVVVTAGKKASNFANWFSGRDVGYSGSGWGHGPRRWLANQFGLGNNASNLWQLGLQSQLQNSHVNLTGDLLDRVKTDPAIVSFQKKIVAILRADPRFRKLTFVLANKQVLGLGGQRWTSEKENWGALNNNNPLAHKETWAVAGNVLTWAVRNASVEYSATAKADGTIVISYHLSDTFDLTPGGRSSAYDNITATTGFLYHDAVGGNRDLKVSANWETTVK